MINHLSQNRLINESQHGFRHQKSCLTNFLEYLKYVVNQIDAEDPVDVIYLDFHKALDKVPHHKLFGLSQSVGQGTPPQVIAKVKGAWNNEFNNKLNRKLVG